MSNLTSDAVAEAFPEYSITPDNPLEGGQRVVHFVEADGIPAVLKILKAPVLEDDEHADPNEPGGNHGAERVRREVEALAAIDSEHLSRVLAGPEVREIGGSPYFWHLEQRYGESLLARLQRTARVPPEEWIALVGSLLRGAEDLHQAGVVHRDIKPANILTDDPTSSWVLTDLGVALHADLPRLTGGTLTRTWMYAAPEQLEPRPIVDPRTDQFAIGLVASQAWTGVHPFWRGDGDEFLKRMEAGVDRAELEQAGMNAEAIGFIAKLLGRRPHLRYRTTARAVRAFESTTNPKGESK